MVADAGKKIPSEIEVAPRHKLFTLLSLPTLLTLFKLFTSLHCLHCYNACIAITACNIYYFGFMGYGANNGSVLDWIPRDCYDC